MLRKLIINNILQVQECQQSRLLNELDVSLCNIDVVYQFLRGDKKRKLIGGNNVDSKIKGLLIVCKV